MSRRGLDKEQIQNRRGSNRDKSLNRRGSNKNDKNNQNLNKKKEKSAPNMQSVHEAYYFLMKTYVEDRKEDQKSLNLATLNLLFVWYEYKE